MTNLSDSVNPQVREAILLFPSPITRSDPYGMPTLRSSHGRSPLEFFVSPIIAVLLTAILLAGSTTFAAQKSKETEKLEKKLKNRPLVWNPPLVDAPIRSRLSTPPCELSKVLELAGARATKLIDLLQNFTAEETLNYQALDRMNDVKEASTGTFEYVVDFQPTLSGTVLRENRNPTHGSRLTGLGVQDVGLPEIALMFLPEMQGDYTMTCEGTVERKAQPAWVVHFQQRADKLGRTISFRGARSMYPAKLRGRAWISAESGEIVHIETSLMEEIPAANVRHWYLTLDYEPVQFQTSKLTVVLPQTVDAYCEFYDYRTIAYHTFTDFLLFSVQTDQKIEKPQQQ